MIDNYHRRNRIAALVAQHYGDLAREVAQGVPDTIGLRADLVAATYLPILAALGGETDPEKLGIDPLSMPALQIASLTSQETT